MNKMRSIAGLVLMITPWVLGCRGPVKEENKHTILNPVFTGQEYTIDTSESVVTWKGSMLGGANSHTGFIYISKGALMIRDGQLNGGRAEVDMNTIEDENHGRNNGLVDHLKHPDFFDVKRFPVSSIEITRAAPGMGRDVKITGNLTIKGVTNTVTFPARVEVKDGIVKANSKLVIDRTRWNVLYKSGKFYDLLADQIMADSIEFHIKIVAKGK
ncbi:YceI family protein [Niabella yanshanensis]|uniref:YceI family protein n=1 Tax=Niabella yanshanensis TaxID=577386 RepID=A0ABZ0W0J0_9BACT|nr:YceI family protein [Niabella yanshanensis]WQD36768.1 YceI family protein [Niabella yanshanensis]